MKKHLAMLVLGGSMAAMARATGCTKQAIAKWPVDERGNFTSRYACDTVLAALVRQNYQHRLEEPDGVRYPFDNEVLDDLLTLPEDCIHVIEE